MVVNVSADIVFYPNSNSLDNADYAETEYNLGWAFFVRAFLSILFGCLPKIFGLSVVSSLLHVALVFFYRNRICNPLKGSEYINSFIYFIKEFGALGIFVGSIALIFTFLMQALNIYFFMN